MTVKTDFVLRQIAGNWVVMPIGEQTLNMPGILTVNDSGAMLWKLLEREQTVQSLVQALTEEYDVSEQTAEADVKEFLEKLQNAGCLET